MNNEQNLQNVIDNMFIALNYNKNIKDFKKLSISFVSPEVLGCRTNKYKEIKNNYLEWKDGEIEYKE